MAVPCPDAVEALAKAGAMTAELPVWVFGRCRWVSGVCRRTTCQDVLEAVLAVPGQPGEPGPQGQQGQPPTLPDEAGPRGLPDASNYVIVERWKGVERRLDARVRILKVSPDRSLVLATIRQMLVQCL